MHVIYLILLNKYSAMYSLHPSQKLNKAFSSKPYQGACPLQAQFLFIGLDANYAPNIENLEIFDQIIAYHEDSVSFWKKNGIHHPFLLEGYKGDGRRFHKEFAKIGLKSDIAEQISFVETMHLPTVGKNNLTIEDLDESHLNYLHDAIFSKSKKAIFMPDSVFKLLKKTEQFAWLKAAVPKIEHPLKVFFDQGPVIYKHLHFSNYGKFQAQKEQEMIAIHKIVYGL